MDMPFATPPEGQALRHAIEDLLAPQMPLDEALDRHFAPGFRQRAHGQWHDRAAFRARMAQLRARLVRATITVLDEHVDGLRYAERHGIDMLLHDGDRLVLEVFVFARLDAQGRFLCIEEVTQPWTASP